MFFTGEPARPSRRGRGVRAGHQRPEPGLVRRPQDQRARSRRRLLGLGAEARASGGHDPSSGLRFRIRGLRLEREVGAVRDPKARYQAGQGPLGEGFGGNRPGRWAPAYPEPEGR